MTDLSVLDLVPIREGSNASEAIAEAGLLAQTAEKAGYKRFWVAEHHASEGIAGGATSVVLGHIGHVTSTIRIGSGGIMLPNHNPFVIAEQFGTLDALFPGRVDLGLGRAPGSAPIIAQALRKDLQRAAEYFPQDVVELRALLTGDVDLPITATPGLGAKVEMWMLGSSLFGAQLAAKLGLPYAFASHFAPTHLDEALRIYRQDFRPSAALEKPHVMAAMSVMCAANRRRGARHSPAARNRPSCACVAATRASCRRRSPTIAIHCRCRRARCSKASMSPRPSARPQPCAKPSDALSIARKRTRSSSRARRMIRQRGGNR